MSTKTAICCGDLAVAAIGSGNKAINETILFGILAERAIELSVTPSVQETLFCSALAVGATELAIGETFCSVCLQKGQWSYQ